MAHFGQRSRQADSFLKGHLFMLNGDAKRRMEALPSRPPCPSLVFHHFLPGMLKNRMIPNTFDRTDLRTQRTLSSIHSLHENTLR